jgi:hypothetical protein
MDWKSDSLFQEASPRRRNLVDMIQADFPRTPSPVVPQRKISPQRERSRTSQPLDNMESPIRPSSTPPIQMVPSPEPDLDLNMLALSLNEVICFFTYHDRLNYPLFNLLLLVLLEFLFLNSIIPSFLPALVPIVHPHLLQKVNGNKITSLPNQ